MTPRPVVLRTAAVVEVEQAALWLFECDCPTLITGGMGLATVETFHRRRCPALARRQVSRGRR